MFYFTFARGHTKLYKFHQSMEDREPEIFETGSEILSFFWKYNTNFVTASPSERGRPKLVFDASMESGTHSHIS